MDRNIDPSFQTDLYYQMCKYSGSYLKTENCSDKVSPLTDPIIR